MKDQLVWSAVSDPPDWCTSPALGSQSACILALSTGPLIVPAQVYLRGQGGTVPFTPKARHISGPK